MSQTRPSSVGVIGLGIMGRAMAVNLARGGIGVFGWDPGKPSLDDIDVPNNLLVMETIEEVISQADTFIVSVPGPPEQQVLFDPDGDFFQHVRRAALVIDTTTTDPSLCAELAERSNSFGVEYLAVGVFGSKIQAHAADLDFVCGGEIEVFNRACPVLEVIGKSQHHLGDASAGMVLKLIGNLLIAAQNVGLAEGLLLAHRFGIDQEALYEVFDQAAFASIMVGTNVRCMLKDDHTPLFKLESLLKDIRLFTGVGRSENLETPIASLALETLQSAADAGFGHLNATVVHKHILDNQPPKSASRKK